jgi:hypothetical protein
MLFATLQSFGSFILTLWTDLRTSLLGWVFSYVEGNHPSKGRAWALCG